MSRGGSLMGKRAVITSVAESTHKDREGFVVDPFWGTQTPASISGLPGAVEQGGQKGLREALTVAVEHLQGGSLEDEDLEGVNGALLRGCLAVVAAAVRARADVEVVARDLGNIGVVKEAVADIVKAVSRSRESISAWGAEEGRGFPRVDDVRWRLDVTISTTHLSRVLRPNALMQLTLSDGSIRTMEVEADKLQELRFHVASALQGMQSLSEGPLANISKRQRDRPTQTVQVKSGIAQRHAAVAAALRAQPAAAPAQAAQASSGGGVPDLPSF